MNGMEQKIVSHYEETLRAARESNDWLSAMEIRLDITALLTVARPQWSAAFVASLQVLQAAAFAVVWVEVDSFLRNPRDHWSGEFMATLENLRIAARMIIREEYFE